MHMWMYMWCVNAANKSNVVVYVFAMWYHSPDNVYVIALSHVPPLVESNLTQHIPVNCVYNVCPLLCVG